jgi:hypothetical protein
VTHRVPSSPKHVSWRKMLKGGVLRGQWLDRLVDDRQTLDAESLLGNLGAMAIVPASNDGGTGSFGNGKSADS